MNFKGITTMTGSLDSLRTLDNIEKDLCTGLQSAGQAIQELSKDKPSMKQVETHSNAFLKTLQTVESSISQQILHLNQVSTGQAHEGSIYASQKVLNMAWHRFEHVKSKLNELEKARSSEVLVPPQQSSQQQQQPPPPPQHQPTSQPQPTLQQLQQHRQQQQLQQQQQQQHHHHHQQQQQHLQMPPK